MPADQRRFGKDEIDDMNRRLIAAEKRVRLANTRRPHLPLMDFSEQGTPFPQDGAIVLDYRGTPLDVLPSSTVKYGYGGEWNSLILIGYEIKLFADLEAVSVKIPRFTFMIPRRVHGFSLTLVDSFVSKRATSGLVTMQVRNKTQAVNMLSTLVTIDPNEDNSVTANTQPLINPATRQVNGGDMIEINVTVAATGAEGAGIVLEFELV